MNCFLNSRTASEKNIPGLAHLMHHGIKLGAGRILLFLPPLLKVAVGRRIVTDRQAPWRYPRFSLRLSYACLAERTIAQEWCKLLLTLALHCSPRGGDD